MEVRGLEQCYSVLSKELENGCGNVIHSCLRCNVVVYPDTHSCDISGF